MKTNILIIAGVFSLIFTSCDNYEQFEKELYKNEIYIISQGNDNFKSIVCDLNDLDSVHYVSFSFSGTTRLDRDVTIEIEEDTILFDKFNYNNFELDETKYIKILDEFRYNFPSTSFVLKANSSQVYGLLPFYIKPENIANLSRDSTYVIPIAIKSVSDYGVKRDKFNAMLRISVNNKYAEGTNTSYNMKGYRGEGTMSGNSIGTTKTVLPLSANSIRFYVGLELPPPKDATAKDINRIAARLIINSDNTLSLEAYKPAAGLLEVEMLPKPEDQTDFPWLNFYEEKPPRFPGGKNEQRFLIYYKYRTKNNDNSWSSWIYMREIINRLW